MKEFGPGGRVPGAPLGSANLTKIWRNLTFWADNSKQITKYLFLLSKQSRPTQNKHTQGTNFNESWFFWRFLFTTWNTNVMVTLGTHSTTNIVRLNILFIPSANKPWASHQYHFKNKGVATWNCTWGNVRSDEKI